MISRKLIISDLDGTLLNKNSELSKFTIDTIKKVVEKGHIFCISTGRPLRSSIKFYNQLGLNTILSSLNGGVLVNPSDKNFNDIFFSFDKDVLFKILKNNEVMSLTNYIVIENINCTYLISKNKDMVIDKEFFKKFHVQKDSLIYIDDINKIKHDILLTPVSILISLDNKNIDKVSFSIKSLLNTFIIRLWNDNNSAKNMIIELNTSFSTKGTAMKYLSCYYGIPLEDIYAFGDGENDIEMIKSIPNAFAMKNANSSVKLIAYKITEKNNNQDGVAKQLIKELNI